MQISNAYIIFEVIALLRIKELRLARKESQQEVANAIGVSQAALSGWENGKYSIDNINLLKLAKHYNVSTDYILNNTNIAPLKQPLTAGRKIDVLGRVPAGTPIEAVESIVDTVELGDKLSNDGHEYFALLITGDSMFPEYRDGEIKEALSSTGTIPIGRGLPLYCLLHIL